jgi:prepilin-type N-terminal cleavage/methylation domain-containing protein
MRINLPHRTDAGFTLIETVCATVIVCIIVAALSGMAPLFLSAVAQNQARNKAILDMTALDLSISACLEAIHIPYWERRPEIVLQHNTVEIPWYYAEENNRLLLNWGEGAEGFMKRIQSVRLLETKDRVPWGLEIVVNGFDGETMTLVRPFGSLPLPLRGQE